MKKRLLYSLFSGCLLGISWPETGGLFPLIFIALVPLLLVENEILTRRYRPGKVYVNAYLTFFVFNLITTWWVWNASAGGAIMAIFANSALMAIPFYLFHLTRRHVGNREGYVALITYWMAFEWGHFRWELSWPWLSYGNVFANQTSIIQWYEYTGVGGGTLWILLINLILFFLIKEYLNKKEQWKPNRSYIIILVSLIIVPILWSIIIKPSVNLGKKNETISVVLSQPNIDPYKKFDGQLTSLNQIRNFLNVTKPNMNQDVDLIIAPETAIPRSLEETNILFADEVQVINEFLNDYPKTSLLTGISSYRFFEEKHSSASKKTADGLSFYENYNSALLIDAQSNTNIYHKSELVLGVERMPFGSLLQPIEEMFDFGGTSGTLGVEKEAKVFKKNNAIIAPTICYESIYGSYTSEFTTKGANVIAIMTNDAWWFDTPGYKQLLAYAKLRAIENRKWIMRSANTGISCFINPKGEITQQTKWEEATSIKADVPLINGQTFYSKHGDYLARLCGFIAIMLFFLMIAKRLRGASNSTFSKK